MKFCTKYVADRYKPAILHISVNGLQTGDTEKVTQGTGLPGFFSVTGFFNVTGFFSTTAFFIDKRLYCRYNAYKIDKYYRLRR